MEEKIRLIMAMAREDAKRTINSTAERVDAATSQRDNDYWLAQLRGNLEMVVNLGIMTAAECDEIFLDVIDRNDDFNQL